MAHLRLLEEAAGQGCTLAMSYVKANGIETMRRELDPYGLVHWKGCWYTVGFCRLRGELRSFRVDRIVSLERTERRFERPSGFSAKDYLLRSLLPGDRSADPLVLVRIRGDELVLNELCQHWLFGHALVERQAGEACFKIGQEPLINFVPYYLLPYGTALRIEEPEFLTAGMVEAARKMVLHYGYGT